MSARALHNLSKGILSLLLGEVNFQVNTISADITADVLVSSSQFKTR